MTYRIATNIHCCLFYLSSYNQNFACRKTVLILKKYYTPQMQLLLHKNCFEEYLCMYFQMY